MKLMTLQYHSKTFPDPHDSDPTIYKVETGYHDVVIEKHKVFQKLSYVSSLIFRDV
jgi:hypothetical protein